MDTLFLILRVAVSLGAVLALIWYAQKRIIKGKAVSTAKTRRNKKSALVVVSRQGLGAKASAVVIEAGSRRFLLGVTDQNVTVLSEEEISDIEYQEEIAQVLETEPKTMQGSKGRPSFVEALKMAATGNKTNYQGTSTVRKEVPATVSNTNLEGIDLPEGATLLEVVEAPTPATLPVQQSTSTFTNAPIDPSEINSLEDFQKLVAKREIHHTAPAKNIPSMQETTFESVLEQQEIENLIEQLISTPNTPAPTKTVTPSSTPVTAVDTQTRKVRPNSPAAKLAARSRANRPPDKVTNK